MSKLDEANYIAKQVLYNLSKKHIEVTPTEYEKEFCKIAKQSFFTSKECEYFDKISQKLSKEEKKSHEGPIETLYDLIDILLKRIEPKILAKKTADISRLISLMNKYLNDAIDKSGSGSKNVSLIQDELESISISNSSAEDLNKIQTKLVAVADNIKKEMDEVNHSFKDNQQEITKLENKIKELENELKKSKEASTKDFLTNTYTRRAYEDELKKFDERYERLQQDYAIVFFDLDHFKKVNDTYGHKAGDIVLKTFAALLLKLTRDIDIVGRYGGEEFIVAIHYNKETELEGYLQRIKDIVSRNKFICEGNKLKITFSAGIDLRSHHNSAHETIASADTLLYKAKNNGRDKIILWNGKEL